MYIPFDIDIITPENQKFWNWRAPGSYGLNLISYYLLPNEVEGLANDTI